MKKDSMDKLIEAVEEYVMDQCPELQPWEQTNMTPDIIHDIDVYIDFVKNKPNKLIY